MLLLADAKPGTRVLKIKGSGANSKVGTINKVSPVSKYYVWVHWDGNVKSSYVCLQDICLLQETRGVPLPKAETIRRLRELQHLKAGDDMPGWLNDGANNWAKPLSELCKRAADLIETIN